MDCLRRAFINCYYDKKNWGLVTFICLVLGAMAILLVICWFSRPLLYVHTMFSLLFFLHFIILIGVILRLIFRFFMNCIHAIKSRPSEESNDDVYIALEESLEQTNRSSPSLTSEIPTEDEAFATSLFHSEGLFHHAQE